MRTLCLLIVGVVVGWAASDVDWSRDAVGQEQELFHADEVGPNRLKEDTVLLREAIADAQRQRDEDLYKALARVDIEKLGGRTNDRNLKYLTAGLNVLATEGWTLVAIEPAERQSISGPGDASVTKPATYIFERKQ